MSLREFLEFQARPFGGWWREFRAIPIYAVNPVAQQQLKSGPSRAGAHSGDGSGASTILALRTGRKQVLGSGKKTSPTALTAAPGCEHPRSPPPQFSLEYPGPGILWRNRISPGEDTLRPGPRSCFTNRTLHPLFLPPTAPPPTRQHLQRKKSQREQSPPGGGMR